MRAAVRAKNRYLPESRLVCVEQTTNLAGGAVWPLEVLSAVAEAAKAAGLATHMDGAAAPERLRQDGGQRPRLRGRVRFLLDRLQPRAWARRWVRCWPAAPTSSPEPGATSSNGAAPCVSPA